MKVEFKIAEEKDILGIIELCNEVFEEKTDYQEAIEIYNRTKDDPNQIYIIGRYNDQIIAHTKITVIPTIFQDMNTYAILNHVCVKEEYRKLMIASQMLNIIKKICKDKGCSSIKLWSRNFRTPAHSFYKKMGFIIDDAAFFYLDI